MTARRDAERLIELCEDNESARAWLAALRTARDEIAIANHGQALTIEAVLRDLCRIRLGITPTGRVIHPLGGDDPPDLRLEGEPRDVAAFLLGEQTVSEAQRRGLLVVSEGVRLDRLEPLRRVVSERLRALSSGQNTLVPLGTVLAWRARRVLELPAELTTLGLAKLAPALVATVAFFGGASPSTATVQLDGQPVASRVAEAARNGPEQTLEQQRGSSKAPPRDVPLVPPRPAPPTRPTSLSVSAGVDRTPTGHDIDVTAEDGTREVPVWGSVRCDKSLSQATLCAVVDTLPPRD